MGAGKGKGKDSRRGSQKTSETGKPSWVSWVLAGLVVTVAIAGVFLVVKGQRSEVMFVRSK
jgi:hypothetical protein